MNESSNPVEQVLQETLKNLRTLIDSNCIIGTPIESGKTTIIPITKASVGFVIGGGEYSNSKPPKKLSPPFFSGGSGGGCNLTPIGFLCINENKTEFIKINAENNIEKIIDIANNFIKSVK